MRFLALLTAALFIAGCGGGGDDVAVEEGQYRSPIGEFFGYDPNQDPEEAQAEFAEQQRQVEALVVDCMAAQGFEYEPVSQDQMVFEDPYADLSPEERAETIGYGFTQWIDEDPMQGEEFHDPNQERVEQMDPAEREAYYAALHGDFPEPTLDEEGEPVFDETFQPSGCHNEAWEEINGGQDVIYRELDEEFNELYERIEADPRLTEATQAWSACMAEAGFTFTSMDEIYEHLNKRMEEDVYLDFDEGSFAVEGDATEGPQGPSYDEEGLEAVREEEIAIATADYACNQENDLEQLRQEVQVELEEAFIEEHREVFDRAREAQDG